MPSSDLTRRYIELVELLGDEMGQAHGWRRRAAERLGVDESTLSKILKGNRQVGWDLAERAIERLSLNPDHFVAPTNKKPSRVAGRSRRDALAAKVESGRATVADVYDLARSVAEAPAVLQARSILNRKRPKSEQETGALFIDALKLIELLRSDAGNHS